MTPFPVPPRHELHPPTHGQLAEYFKDWSTADMIALYRQLAPADEADEDKVLEEARARGEVSHLTVLGALHERATRDVFDAAVALCNDPEPRERIIGLRILSEMEGIPQNYPEVWGLWERMADGEPDPDALRWVIRCLRDSGDPRAKRTVLRFVDHPDPDIRSTISWSLRFIGEGIDEGKDDPEIIDALVRFADDEDGDVRWNAIDEFVENIRADSPAIRAVLQEAADNDPDEEIRELAQRALDARGIAGRRGGITRKRGDLTPDEES